MRDFFAVNLTAENVNFIPESKGIFIIANSSSYKANKLPLFFIHIATTDNFKKAAIEFMNTYKSYKDYDLIFGFQSYDDMEQAKEKSKRLLEQYHRDLPNLTFVQK